MISPFRICVLALPLLLWGAPSWAQADAPSDVIATLDDRRLASLNEPWVTVYTLSGLSWRAAALDDGSDPLDLFAGDRLYIARLRIIHQGEVKVAITDGGPLGVGHMVKTYSARLTPGSTSRIGYGRESQGSPITAAIEDLAPLIGNEALEEMVQQMPSTRVPWPKDPYEFAGTSWSWWPQLFGLLSIGLLARLLLGIRRFSERELARIRTLSERVDRMAEAARRT